MLKIRVDPGLAHTVLTSPIDDPPADRGFAAAAASGLTRLSWLLAADCDLLLLRKLDLRLGPKDGSMQYEVHKSVRVKSSEFMRSRGLTYS